MRSRPRRVDSIPGESAGQQALAAVNRNVFQELGRRSANQKIATVDLDAKIIESWKREAKPTYERQDRLSAGAGVVGRDGAGTAAGGAAGVSGADGDGRRAPFSRATRP